MDPVAEAILLSWNFDPWVVIPLLAGAVVYFRGWLFVRNKLPHRFGAFRLVAFQSGLVAVLLALASPIDVFAGLLLFVHMTQHILLTMVAPPLLLLGAPMLPLLRGLPRAVSSRWVGPILAVTGLVSLGPVLVRPGVALASFSVATVAWHWPVLYELALRSEFWHQIEHACFFVTGLLFWWPVVQPWPSRGHWSGWAMILYLLAADLVNTAVSAILCFAERVLYPTYAAGPELWGISALADQSAAGAIMWVAGSLAFLLPAGWILTRLLEPSLVRPPGRASRRPAFTYPRRGDAPRKPRAGRRALMVLFLVALSQLTQPPPALAHHGGIVQFKEASGPYVVTLFSESAPVHAGRVELSVLVQDESGAPVLDAEVGVELVHERGQEQPIKAVAVRTDASNKLMYTAAGIHLRIPGVWETAIRVQKDGSTVDTRGQLVVESSGAQASTWLYLIVSGGTLAAAGLAWRQRRASRPRVRRA